MLANGFKGCQSGRIVLQSASFRNESGRSNSMQSLVSSQSFPHLWKKLWKKAGNYICVSIQGLIHADFGGGETPQGRPDGLFSGADAASLWKSRFEVRRKPAEGDFSLNK